MEFNLTADQKLASLQGASSMLNQEIYNLLLRIGVDPDEFEEEDIESLRTPALDGEISRLQQLLAALSVVTDKLSAL